MKILHTSDWHLGHTLYNYDRTEEQMAMLLQMVDIVREEKPDVFLLCGDVYHTPQPSASVQTMFTNALVEIHDANPNMTIVITAGNHDSGTKHDIFRTPWKALKVYTIGSVDANNKEDLIIEIPGQGYVIAVPYVNERNMPDGFFQDLLDIVAERNKANLPVLMTAHTTVSGCDFTGHENASEYSGTPIPVSFDENYQHSVSIVELNKHGEKPVVKEIDINTHRPLVTLPKDGVATWEDAKDLLEGFPNDIEAYIRLNVEVDNFLPIEANAEALLLTEGKKCRFCVINTHRLKKDRREAKVMSVQEFKTEKPIDIAERYAEDIGVEFDDDIKELFNETLALLKEEERK